MTATHPASTPHLIGHDDAMRQVTEAFGSGRMHHAWLMVGPDGIGKTTLAYHIANHALSSGQNPLGRIDLQHRIAKLIMAEAHPDMLVIRRAADEKTGELRNVIVVDDALKIGSFLHRTSTHGGWRVVIIDEAHRLNRHGQNAILKILEEPPARALILMTATTPGALLPTIRSRSRVLHLASLDHAQMKAVLSRQAPALAADDLDQLIALSEGSIGFALKILRTETLPLYAELIGLMQAMPELDIVRLHKLADQISRKADAESFEILSALLLQYMRVSISTAARHGADGASLNRKMEMWDKLRATFAVGDSGNLDRKLTFIKAISDIRAAIA